MQAHSMRSVRVRSKRRAARFGAERLVVRGSLRREPSSSSTSKEIDVVGRPRRRERLKKRGESRYREARGDGGTKAACRKPDGASSSARSIERLSESDSPGGTGARESYSSENVSAAVIEVTSFTTWRENVTAKCNEYARMRFLKYVAVHRQRAKSEVETDVSVGPLKLISGKPRTRW